MFGFLNIDKPKGMTSHDVVAILRRTLKIKQIGHSGTLDPMATGVLPIAIGKATRLIEYLPDDKSYLVTAQLGFISDSYDSDGNVEKFSDKLVNLSAIENFIPQFIGTIKQRPPIYSAVHHNGKRLYELARSGEQIEDIPEREVVVRSISIKEFDFDTQVLKLEIECEKGTYIRSIVHDLGQLLEVGAIMTDLIRLSSSQFVIADAISLDESITKDMLTEKLVNPSDVLKLDKIVISDEQFNRIKNGNFITASGLNNQENVLLEHEGRLVSAAKVDGDLIKPSKVLV